MRLNKELATYLNNALYDAILHRGGFSKVNDLGVEGDVWNDVEFVLDYVMDTLLEDGYVDESNEEAKRSEIFDYAWGKMILVHDYVRDYKTDIN